jgi:NAD-dependent SIR2 family protein deacetylase
MTEWSSLDEFVDRHRRLFVLTGGGCRTSSGIPDYRDPDGQWRRRQPVTYQAFMADEATRRRYWVPPLRDVPDVQIELHKGG